MVRKSLAQILVDKRLFTPIAIEDYQNASNAEHKSLDDYLRAHSLIKDEVFLFT